jgi:hypothetical protein
MILFELKCPSNHVFEAWFRNGDTYEAQSAAHEITCPFCGSTEIEKAPMAPRVAKSRAAETGGEVIPPGTPERNVAVGPNADPNEIAFAMHKALKELRRQVETNCENVGDRFAEEARKIHYGEADARGIYGDTTPEEASALKEEGVEFARIPWLPRVDN